MSYCRWSSDNFKCELYCYESVHGCWTIHVAARKRVGTWPDELPFLPDGYDTMTDEDKKAHAEKWLAHHRVCLAEMEKCPLAPIGLPHDGESFDCPDLESFKEKLLYLRGVGYKFPDYVLEAVEEEIKEELNGTKDAAESEAPC